MHILWQKRIRIGDVTTPFWFPSVTNGGEMRADRIAFPIPAGTSWRDVLPVILPGSKDETDVDGGLLEAKVEGGLLNVGETPALVVRTTIETPQSTIVLDGLTLDQRIAGLPVMGMGSPAVKRMYAKRRLEQVEALRAMYATAEAERAAVAAKVKATARKAIKKEKAKASPRLVSFAREVRDRWMEGQEITGQGPALTSKYDVRRSLGHGPEVHATREKRTLRLEDIIEGEVIAA